MASENVLQDEGKTPGQPAALETEELSISFGGHVAVDGVSCAFHAAR